MLQVCAALDLDLINDSKKEIGFKYPFMIRLDIGVEPADVYSFVKLFLTDDSLPEKNGRDDSSQSLSLPYSRPIWICPSHQNA
jgi:hypothetical protein